MDNTIGPLTFSKVLLIIAVILFVITAIGVASLSALGLAFFAGAFLVK